MQIGSFDESEETTLVNLLDITGGKSIIFAKITEIVKNISLIKY